MTMITNPLTLSAAALALFLAGCGGSDDPPAGGQGMMCPEGQTGTPPNCVDPEDMPPPPVTSSLDLVDDLEAATMALATKAGSATTDGSALKDATAANETALANLGTAEMAGTAEDAKVQGVSAFILAAGNEVLAAKMALETDLMATKAALEAAEERRAGLAATDPNARLLDAAIKAAKEAIEVAEIRRDASGRGSLSALAKMYVGKGKTPAERASDYAGRVKEVIMAAILTNSDTSSLPTEDAADNVFAKGTTRTAGMRTFAEIFADELVDVRYADPVKGSLPKGIPVEGESPAADIVGITVSDEDDRRFRGNFKNIAGTFVYAGALSGAADDMIEGVATTEKFGKDWYFVPEKDTDVWTVTRRLNEGAVVTTYEKAKYLEWGMWIDGLKTGDDMKLNRYIGKGAGSDGFTTSDLNFKRAADATQDKTASYTGTAAGLSARTTGTGNSEVHHSGHFTADVALTATFKAAADDAELKGTISNFEATGQGTAHVGNWSLTLAKKTSWGEAFKDGMCADNGPKCTWTAQAYGTSGEEPTGIYGEFNGSFPDGEAAGVYHATQ